MQELFPYLQHKNWLPAPCILYLLQNCTLVYLLPTPTVLYFLPSITVLYILPTFPEWSLYLLSSYFIFYLTSMFCVFYLPSLSYSLSMQRCKNITFFTRARFEPKLFYLKKCVNYDKSNSRQNTVKGPKDKNSAKKCQKIT